METKELQENAQKTIYKCEDCERDYPKPLILSGRCCSNLRKVPPGKTTTALPEDLRTEDIAILKRHGINFDWISEWEDKLCKGSNNQTLWHLSRNSYLAGYLRAKEDLLSELVEYKELIGSPCLQSQLDKRKEIEEWMGKKGRSQNDNFNKAIIAHFIEKHKEKSD